MSIFRTNDPTQFDDVDGIIIDESAPPPNVQGVAANIACLVGQTQRGIQELADVGSIGEFFEKYGKDDTKGANKALKNKRFGRLKFIRVIANDAALATMTFIKDGSPDVNVIKFDAKQGKGAYGNSIQVKIEAGSTTGKKYTIKDTSAGAVLPQEVYDNVVITTVTANKTFENSQLVVATVLATTDEPDNIVFTALAGGSDGSVADTDYQSALALAAVENSCNILFLDEYNTTRNGYLKTHAADTQDKMVIVCGAEGDSVSTAVSAVANLRDNDGRIIYGYPYVQTTIAGVSAFQNPASWIASIISQTSPHIDPAYKKNTQFLAGITGLKNATMTRANYISLKEAGICAFEFDADIGYAIKSGIVTQIADSSKITILRRRMADFLTNSAAKFLKNYQNAVNSKENRTQVKGALLAFIKGLENDKVLPSDADVKEGKAKLVDTEVLNTDLSIAQGFFKIKWQQRIFSSMRFIVLQAQIGESVVVTEQ